MVFLSLFLVPSDGIYLGSIIFEKSNRIVTLSVCGNLGDPDIVSVVLVLQQSKPVLEFVEP